MNDIEVIHLTNGGFTIVDAQFFTSLSRFKWRKHTGGYAYRCENSRKKIIYLHRVVNNTPNGLDTDHKNRFKLDNRACNLRTATTAQNSAYKHIKKSGRLSRFRGVTLFKGKWQAQIGKRSLFLGYFTTEEDAAKAYNAAAIEKYGEFAILNKVEMEIGQHGSL